ncbi:hypothetical protein IQA85_08140 [Leptospira borgpetersenii serovar Ballum]|uniref:hypothetical protein n=1 Tax=Leptospira borgpetersenii TaxID=174 RepID=UPI00187EB41B|nr:hypothetical protein [Leptospira borgpetersenii]MBE8251285.1 hypothetical protein [Leptospira borgpetersenii serovar Ballum]MBE8257662.1 hypothetical protein [Leptospira borgpetersenii serovar Ballum]MBE8299107.1 hypothetical protein [Leptospira borgpetersenii serovar Ballum]
MQLTKTKNKQKKLRSAKRNQNFAYRFAYLVLFLLHGITALSFLFYSKSAFMDFKKTLDSVFTNPVQAVGKTELLPEPNSTYNLEITSAAWETAAELAIEESENRNKEDDSKHTKIARFDPVEDGSYPNPQTESGSKENRKKNTIDEISKSEFLIKDQKIKTFSVFTDFPNQEPNHIQKIETSKSEPPDEVQNIKTSKPNRRDKLTQLYIQEVERYLSRNSQKKNEAPLPKEYSEVVIDSLEQVHWKEDSKFDSLEDAQIQSKTIPTIRQDVAVSEPDFEEETAHPQKVIESVSDLRVKEKVKNRFSETVTSRKEVLNLELNSDEEIKNRFRKTAYISKMWELPRKPDNHKTYSKADDRQRDENSSLDFYFLESPSVNTAIKEEKSNFSIEDPIANSEHTFVSKIYQETPVVASWETETDPFEIRILENANIERWVWIQIQEKLKEIKNKTLQNKAPSLFASGKEILLYFPRREESRRKNQPNPKKQGIVSTLSGYIRKNSNSLILERFLEVPNVNRKQMRYYAIRTNGPPPTVHKQV